MQNQVTDNAAHAGDVVRIPVGNTYLGISNGRDYMEWAHAESRLRGDNPDNASLLWTQLVGVVATIAFATMVTFVLLKLIDLTMGIRNTDQDQHDGLDLVEHGEKGYHELV